MTAALGLLDGKKLGISHKTKAQYLAVLGECYGGVKWARTIDLYDVNVTL